MDVQYVTYCGLCVCVSMHGVCTCLCVAVAPFPGSPYVSGEP